MSDKIENNRIEAKSVRPLQKMFNEVPGRYDLMNRLLTLRFDEIWRKKAARLCLENNPEKIMDICTGTGDLAIRLARSVNHDQKIIGLDFSEPMLNEARKKSKKKGLNNINYINADVAELPYPDDFFDSIGIGFAFRNLTYKNPKTNIYLPEILRVLKKGGRFVIVETCQPRNIIVKRMYHLYMKMFVNKLGGVISGHKAAYRYLANSVINFYDSDDVKKLLLEYGFKKVDAHLFMNGIAAIYVSFK